ncbi:MAG: nucleotidyltransferase domain-containing protein [Candidatus Sericytochromatia bacterium]
MEQAELLGLVEELKVRHGCHTLILYGSRAHGTETAASDIDIVCFRAEGEAISDCRRWGEYWLDAWINPEQMAEKPQDFLHLDGGRVLTEAEGFGARLLADVAGILAQPWPGLREDERRHRRVWLQKTLARIRRGDPEAWYRRHSLVVELLENALELRGQRFMGFKRSLRWLQDHDPELYAQFVRLYSAEADLALIEQMVNVVIGYDDLNSFQQEGLQ